jgi:predicted type IV restriction endonuclease
MEQLHALLSQLRHRITRYRDQAIGEQNTKSILIEPLLRALGWEVEDFEEVQREYRPKPADNPVDYALFILRTPRLFVEAKALGGNLDDRKWANQIMGYAAVTGVEWVVLTDGNDYRIYNAHAPVPIEEKLFRSVRVIGDAREVADTLDLLSKAQMRENLIEVLWQSYYVDRQIRATIEALFGPEPDTSLVRLVRNRLPKLSPAEVKASLTRVRIRLDFPAVAATVARPLVESGVATEERESESSEMPSARGEGTPWRGVMLKDVISAGLVQLPLELHRIYKGRSFVGRITAAESIWWEGQEFESLSTAAGVARASVIGRPPDRKYPQTNGWTFWHFTDEDGRDRPLDELRQKCYQRHIRSGASDPEAMGT